MRPTKRSRVRYARCRHAEEQYRWESRPLIGALQPPYGAETYMRLRAPYFRGVLYELGG
jgi:hypothetical protein